MSGPIQNIPPGLLGFFQLKNVGKNPGDLAEQLVPTLSMRDWYFAAEAAPLANDSSVLVPNAGRGFNASAGQTVPDSEFWWVDWMTCYAALIGGEQLQITPAVTFTGPAAASGFHLLSESYQPNVVGAADTAVVARGFWLQPGTVPGVFVANAVTAANIGVSIRIRGTRLTPI